MCKKLLTCSLMLVLFLGLQSFTRSYSQAKISINLENATIEQALKQIKESGGYGIFYKSADLSNQKRVNLNIKEVSVEKALSVVLANTGLTYAIKEGVIFVQKADLQPPASPNSKPEVSAGKINIKGVVKDATGEALIGVSVAIKGSKQGVITDIDGNFEIPDVDENATLEFTYVGYKTLVLSIDKQTNLHVIMEMATTELEETVVVGYMTRKKSTLTGSVKALDGAKISAKPVASFDMALQGQVAGLYTMSSGVPGGSTRMMIRGVSTANPDGSQPLFILDGAVISPQNFASINPNDIEQYTVLKDASATSIYGSLAANGVVLLTSKRGRDMRPEITFRTQLGTTLLADQNFEVMNTSQRLQYEEELGMRTLDATGQYYITTDANGNIISKQSKQDLLNINTNWVDEIFRRGSLQSYEVSLRGGSTHTKYYASANYYDQVGILPSSEFNRYGIRLNLDQDVTQALTVGISATIGQERRQDVMTGNNTSGMSTLNPVFASYALLPYYKPYNDDGQLIDFQCGELRNPLLFYSMSDMHVNQLKAVVNIYAELQLSKQLKFKSSLGTNYQSQNGFTYTNPEWSKNVDGVKGALSRNYKEEQNTTNTNLFTYRETFNKNHNLTILLGEELLMSHDQGFDVSVLGFSNDKIRMFSAAETENHPTDSEAKWVTLSFFSQLSYNWMNKYFVDLSLRRDGSSRFGKDSKWGTFGSVGLSWNLKREKFLEDSEVISLLNLMASTGTTGNSNVGTYESFQTYSYKAPYNGETGSAPNRPGNSDLHWETVWKNNIGTEIMLYDKYRFKLEGYYNKTSDMLFEEPLSLTSGFSRSTKNVGNMINKGLELEWDLTLLQTKNMIWKFSGNVTYNQSKMENLSVDYDRASYLLSNGLPFGTYYLVRYAGVDPLNGNPLWYTADDKITDVYSENNRVLLDKSFIPPYMGGFGSDFSYKDFGASILFSWIAKRYMLDQTSAFINSNGYWKAYNQGVDMLDYWKKPGDVTPYPYPDATINVTDTRYLDNASFLRLKNLTFYYNLNKGYLEKLKLIRSVRLSLQAQNLFTFTSYHGFDPEHMGALESNIYPQSRAFTFGLDITF